MQVITQSIGSDRRRRLTLRTPAGLAAAGFTADDVPTCELWAGDDRAILATPPAEWDDPAAGTVILTIAGADTAGLTPATYRGRVWVLSQGLRIDGGDFALRLTSSPGLAEAEPTYCGLGDLEQLASGWVDDLQDLDDDQAGFNEELGLARKWLDRQVLARRRAWLDQWYRLRAAWPDDAAIEADLLALQAALDAGGLMRDALDGGMVERITAHYALHLICEPQVGETDETSYQLLAGRHHVAAVRMLAGWTARVDTDADGVADLYLG